MTSPPAGGSETAPVGSTHERRERCTLWIVLLLNLSLAGGFLAAGLFGDSSALIANGLDNSSDGLVYALSLVALGRAPRWKRIAATASGMLLLLFAAGVIVDVIRRIIQGSEPIGQTMMAMAAIAAVVNIVCYWLLKRLNQPDVNLRAATTFSFNDFISNGGILLGGRSSCGPAGTGLTLSSASQPPVSP